MVDKNILVGRVEQIEKHLRKIAAYRRMSLEEFLRDEKTQDIVEYNLFQIVNHFIDIIQHIVVDEEYGFPQTAYEAAQILADKKILTAKDLEIFKNMIGFRNVVGHDYIEINKKTVYDILTTGEKEIKRVLSRISEKIL
ncbi:MAG: DUF86 domain-containing protein [Candidatus Omnitrophica bacterium]|nr:DUF86 domain-containing protein [Candidatus Omnitrophota bacterium]